MEKCLIVAVDDHLGIGAKGDLPWHISEDLKYFKSVTHGYPVIMGRTTYESLPFKPLKGRLNIVLSRGCTEIPGVVCVKSLDAAFDAAGDAEKCFVIGGASVYKEAIEMMDTLYITNVHTVVEDADAFFPQVDPTVWKRHSVSETHRDEETGFEFEFSVYKKLF